MVLLIMCYHNFATVQAMSLQLSCLGAAGIAHLQEVKKWIDMFASSISSISHLTKWNIVLSAENLPPPPPTKHTHKEEGEAHLHPSDTQNIVRGGMGREGQNGDLIDCVSLWLECALDKTDIVVQIVTAFNIPTRTHQDAIRYARGNHFSISCQKVCVHVHNKVVPIFLCSIH